MNPNQQTFYYAPQQGQPPQQQVSMQQPPQGHQFVAQPQQQGTFVVPVQQRPQVIAQAQPQVTYAQVPRSNSVQYVVPQQAQAQVMPSRTGSGSFVYASQQPQQQYIVQRPQQSPSQSVVYLTHPAGTQSQRIVTQAPPQQILQAHPQATRTQVVYVAQQQPQRTQVVYQQQPVQPQQQYATVQQQGPGGAVHPLQSQVHPALPSPKKQLPATPADIKKSKKEAKMKEKEEKARAAKEEKKMRKENAAREKKEKNRQKNIDDASPPPSPPPRTSAPGAPGSAAEGGGMVTGEETVYYTSSDSPGEVNEGISDVDLGDFVVPASQITLEQLVGSDSMGETFQGKYIGTDVNVKKLNKMSKESASQFLTELKMLRTLRHPNVVLYMGICLDWPDESFLVITEFCSRGLLRDFIHSLKKGKQKFKKVKNEELTMERFHTIVFSMSKGMNYLHNRDPPVVHRDLNPGSFYIGDNWEVRITDFGLALSMQSTMKEGTSVVGSPNYIAPEIIRGENYNEKCDVYSFGMILYELIERKQPFEGIPSFKLLNAVAVGRQRPQVSPDNMTKSHLRPYISLMQKCWNENHGERPSFSAISSMLEDIQEQNLADDILGIKL